MLVEFTQSENVKIVVLQSVLLFFGRIILNLFRYNSLIFVTITSNPDSACGLCNLSIICMAAY